MSAEKAIKKINAEMQKDPTNLYLEIVGHYLIDRCTDAKAAKAILADKKTLSGAMSAVESAARKKASKGCAVMKDFDIFDVVDAYFDLPCSASARAESKRAVDGGSQAESAQQSQRQESKAVDLDFDSFLL